MQNECYNAYKRVIYSKNHKENNIIENYCKNKATVNLPITKTYTNDPTITRKIRYSNIVRNNNFTTKLSFLGIIPTITNITYEIKPTEQNNMRNIYLQYETDINLGKYDVFCLYWIILTEKYPTKYNYTILTKNNNFTIANVDVGKTCKIFAKVNLNNGEILGEYTNEPLLTINVV